MNERTLYPEGRVKIYDNNTNKVLLDNHNMILQFGRDYIKRLFLGNVFYKADDIGTRSNFCDTEINDAVGNNLKIIEYPHYYFESITFGNNPSATVLDGSYPNLLMEPSNEPSDIDNNGNGYLSVYKVTFDSNNVALNYDASTTALKITVTIQTDATNVIARELGLVLKSDGGNSALFSRISFDPLAIEPNSSLTLEYTIYF